MDNVTPSQRDLLTRLRRDRGSLVRWDEGRGVAGAVRAGGLGRWGPDGDAVSALGDLIGLFASTEWSRHLRTRRERGDGEGWRHVELQQAVPTTAGTLDVYRALLAIHVRADGVVGSVQSSCYRDVAVRPFSPMKPERIRDLARGDLVGTVDPPEADPRDPWFPLTGPPRLVVYAWRGTFRPAWVAHLYAPPADRGVGRRTVEFGKGFFDAVTGERFLFTPLSRDAVKGTGFGVTPLDPPFTVRSLNVLHDAASGTHTLHDDTHGRPIVTHDAGAGAAFDTEFELLRGIADGTLPASTDGDGSGAWNRVPASSTDAERGRGQQPEVDLHHYLRQAYEWYATLSSIPREGWDDGQFPDPAVGTQVVRGVAHFRKGSDPRSLHAGARLRRHTASGRWYYWLQFCDGNPATFTYPAGSRFLVAHEYQHAITDFSFDEDGVPGMEYTPGWPGACHEGLSDAFAGFFSGDWRPGRDLSGSGRIMRNLAFPRDATAFDGANLDHFADADMPGAAIDPYMRAGILANAAYLTAAGGIHQRALREPQLLSVDGIGATAAARVWYRALTFYFGTAGATTNVPAADALLFPRFRDACDLAAVDLFGEFSPEHATVVAAFHAVGLGAPEPTGPAPFLLPAPGLAPESRPFVGLAGPGFGSPDLFVDGGTVHCRVRNAGDAPATEVVVTVESAPLSTSEGPFAVLGSFTIPVLPVGVSTWDTSVAAPAAGVPTSLRARVGTGTPVASSTADLVGSVEFLVGNPTGRTATARLVATVSLPEGWTVTLSTQELTVDADDVGVVRLEVTEGVDESAGLLPPFDGAVSGRIDGAVSGTLTGLLSGTAEVSGVLSGTLSGTLDGVMSVHGAFTGTLDRATGALTGVLSGGYDGATAHFATGVRLSVNGLLRPHRRVEVAQIVDGRPVGGITFEVPAAPST
ncbi:hypothetical protein Val02_37540 [Virgisporangium aliadipatigenens]|uniref:Peptidase M4 C-terminal domain-containing protein n=1 Tax=Virgisporangium aliadipatigenens TaxID=741659 RepID=A0A8J3YNE5_9ACTN|nr:M4 family metallopeptidase [Virgisporangium aliadipatigenens]GIJ46868.1 hypothetical protein Val02_37540 [Virgisporangium aliadipatigenens]